MQKIFYNDFYEKLNAQGLLYIFRSLEEEPYTYRENVQTQSSSWLKNLVSLNPILLKFDRSR